jgi:large subunit ribosomal protein L10
MQKQQKTMIIDELTDSLSKSQLVLFTDYKGMNVETISKLREALSKVNAQYRVVKNTLLKISLKKINLYPDEIEDHLQGTTAIMYTQGDPILALKSGLFEEKFITADQAKEFSNLPSRDVLIAQLVGQFQAPIYALHAVLSGTLRKLLYVLNEVGSKKSN